MAHMPVLTIPLDPYTVPRWGDPSDTNMCNRPNAGSRDGEVSATRMMTAPALCPMNDSRPCPPGRRRLLARIMRNLKASADPKRGWVDGQTDREIDRQGDRDGETQTQTCRQAERQAGRQRTRQKDRETEIKDKQRDRETRGNKKTNRETDRKTKRPDRQDQQRDRKTVTWLSWGGFV